MDSKFVEKMHSSEKIFSGQLLHVFKDEVILPNGKQAIREYIKHQGAAVVIPYLGDGKILMVRQYRYPIHQTIFELPAGKTDPGETAAETIKRELEEETGYCADTFIQLPLFHPTVGYSDEAITLFWASGLKETETNPDPDEFLENVIMSIDEAMELVITGKITDSKTIIGLFWAERIFKSEELRQKYNISL